VWYVCVPLLVLNLISKNIFFKSELAITVPIIFSQCHRDLAGRRRREDAFNLSMQMQMFVRNRGINKCALCENVCMCVCPCRVVVAGFGKKLL